MENLFRFATRELSQDAFLRWFFESANEDETFKPIVADFIRYFTKNQKNERPVIDLETKDIIKIKTYAQINKIDVSVDIFSKKFNGHKTIVIEDKTESNVHNNQLEVYNNSIKNWRYEAGSSDDNVYKVFYKTSTIGEDERKRVKDSKWTWFDLQQIHSFFIKYKNKTDSHVLNDYIDHLTELITQSENDKLPSEHNILEWKAFFERTLKPALENDASDIKVSETFYGYAYLNVRPKGADPRKTPYFEIRSRDCLNNSLIGRILLYGVDQITSEEKTRVRTKINNSTSQFHSENNKKQIASTSKRKQENIKYNDQDDFIRIVKELVDDYLSVIK